jgi:hypothetical protein
MGDFFMCKMKPTAIAARKVTPSGEVYYDDTPEGHAAATEDMQKTMGSGASESGQGGAQPGGDAGATPAPQPDPKDCSTYTDALWDTACSKYFKFSQMKYKPVENPEAKLTAQQIACNWQKVCQNVLDPLVDAGFKITISSGYRTPAFDKSLGAKNSIGDHPCGRAVDIQILGQGDPSEKAKGLFKHIGKNMNGSFSQLIYEGRWVHVAHGGNSPEIVSVLVARNGTAPYQQVGGRSGSRLDPDLKWA